MAPGSLTNLYERMNCLNSKERVFAVLEGKEPDRTPVLGGWIANPVAICEIAGLSFEEYRKDPLMATIKAYEILGTDAILEPFVPIDPESYRFLDKSSYAHADKGMSLEEAVEKIDNMPTPEKVEASFDFEGEYQKFKEYLLRRQKIMGDMVFMPAAWQAGSKVSWYFDFGYEIFFTIVGLYPDRAQKLMEIGGAEGRNWSRVIARAVKEGLYPKAVFLGEDICTQRGPMISPDFLEKYYAPQLKRGLEPLLEVGCKPVWHCDGDVRKILDMVIECGAQGLQGFQPECGMDIDYVVKKRTRDGKPLLIFGPLAVTTELPVLSPEEVRQKVRYAIDVCKGKADLMLFTSNTINPDVPVENIKAMYEAVRE